VSEATSVTAQALYNHTGSGYDMSNRCVLRRDRKTAGLTLAGRCVGSIWPCPLPVATPTSSHMQRANTAAFMSEAACQHDANIQKNTKYLSGNSAHTCQKCFQIQGGFVPLTP